MRIRRLSVFAIVLLNVSGAAAADDNVYFGNLHAHTVYSDGSGTPEEAFKAARTGGLDFIAVTEHSHKAAEGSGDTQRIHIARNPKLYNGAQAKSLISTAKRLTIPGKFVAIYGQEFSTISKGNHINVFDVPDVIDVPNTEFRQLLDWTAAHPDSSGRPALLQLNHPALADDDDLEYGRDDFASEQAWISALDAQAELIELFNGPAKAKTGGNRSAAVQEADYYDYLNLGMHLAPSVGHDNHYRTWGIVTDARVAVIAPALTKEALFDAMRARHAYATSDKNLKLVFRADAALQGDIVAASPPLEADLPLTLTINDADEPAAHYRIDVFSDVPGGDPMNGRQPANSFLFDGNTSTPLSLDGVPFLAAGQYVLVRVTQLPSDPEDETLVKDVAWTAPIWFAGAVPGAFPPSDFAAMPSHRVKLTRVLPDPNGPDLRLEKIWLQNATGSPVDLAGWTLVDLSGNIWRLSGRLGAGEERFFLRDGEPLSLNNNGDRLELRDSTSTVVQTAAYGPAAAGEEVPIP